MSKPEPTVSSSTLLYPHDAQLSPPKAALAAFQQIIAMFVGCITPVLIFCSAVPVEPEIKRYMIGMALFASGVGTFLQAKRLGPIGSGLLSVNGTSFAYVDLILRAGMEGGAPLACGMAMAAAPLQLVLAYFLPTLRKLFTPLVAGLVVLLIGLDLIPIAGYYIGSSLKVTGGWELSALLAGVVALTLIIMQFAPWPMVRISGPLIAIGIGYVLSSFFGIIDWGAMQTEQWIVIPQPFIHGLAFKWELLIPFALIYLVSSIEAIGDLTATASLSGLKTTGLDFWKRVRGGILSDAITSIFSTILGVFPTATFSQNNGVIQITGVGSRQVGLYVAGFLVLTGLIPQTGYFFSLMPQAVLGGVTLILFGLIAAAGVRMILGSPIDSPAMLTIAVSLGIALSIPEQEAFVEELPEFLQALFSSTVATGGMVALIMNIAFMKLRKDSPAAEI